jgi:hypothetical protein
LKFRLGLVILLFFFGFVVEANRWNVIRGSIGLFILLLLMVLVEEMQMTLGITVTLHVALKRVLRQMMAVTVVLLLVRARARDQILTELGAALVNTHSMADHLG